MSLDASDIVDSLLDEQARRNSAVDEGEIENLINDLQQIFPVELIGLDGAEGIATSVTHPPHLYDDGQSAYGFVSYG